MKICENAFKFFCELKNSNKFLKKQWTRRSSRAWFCTESLSNNKWQQPDGYQTGIQVYNTATRCVVPLHLKHPNLIKWYICGPTVYDESHIGHASCYVRFDILRRILEEYFDMEVVMAMSITDIDDKIIQKSLEMAVSIENISRHYEKEFFYDMNVLRVKPPTKIFRVTEHINKIIAFCSSILDRGLAYVTVDGTMYFSLDTFGNGRTFVQSPASEAELRASIDPHKRNARDFALWKGAKPGEPFWISPWGKGRPGWHIECSAMASEIFGDQVDIHSGGQDLIFPHHENEESQSQAFHGCRQWVNYWLHSGHLMLKEDEKMSKSLKNTVTIKDFLNEYTADEFRMLCLMIPYRNVIEYSPSVMELAKGKIKKMKSFVDDCEAYIEGKLVCGPINEEHLLKQLEETKRATREFLENDFNTARCLDVLLHLIGEANKNFESRPLENGAPRAVTAISACMSYMVKTARLFGMEFVTKQLVATSIEAENNLLPDVMDAFLEFRSQVRLYALTSGSQSKPQFKSAPGSTDDTQEGKLPQLPERPLEANTEWVSSQKRSKFDSARKEREPLLLACDKVRTTLGTAGIEIKDRRKSSSWGLIADRSLEGKQARLGRHNTFEPQYEPGAKR